MSTRSSASARSSDVCIAPADVTLAPPGMQQVAVLGHTFWQRRLHGDPGVLGRTIRVENVPFTIVGVAPPGFTGFGISAEPDVTVPLPAVALIHGRPSNRLPTDRPNGLTLWRACVPASRSSRHAHGCPASGRPCRR